jgi:hypothetical protein
MFWRIWLFVPFDCVSCTGFGRAVPNPMVTAFALARSPKAERAEIRENFAVILVKSEKLFSATL